VEKFKMLIEEQNRLESLKSRDELTERGLQMLTELNEALQLLQSRVVWRSEQLACKCKRPDPYTQMPYKCFRCHGKIELS
jgi:hypothetical protein